MNNKGVALSIWILFFGTLVLSILVLFYLNSHASESSVTLNLPVNVDGIINDARIAEFYLEDAFIKAASGIDSSMSPERFMEIYYVEIELLKRAPMSYNPGSDGSDFAIEGLEGIQDQLIPENVVINNEGIVLTLEISLFREHLDGDGSLRINHKYRKTFTKAF